MSKKQNPSVVAAGPVARNVAPGPSVTSPPPPPPGDAMDFSRGDPFNQRTPHTGTFAPDLAMRAVAQGDPRSIAAIQSALDVELTQWRALGADVARVLAERMERKVSMMASESRHADIARDDAAVYSVLVARIEALLS